MSNVGYATVSIIPSAKGFGAALNKQVGPAVAAGSAKQGKAAGGKFKGAFMAPLAALGPAVAGVMGAAVVGGFLKGAVNQASDLAEVGTALQTVFGNGVKEVEAFGATGAKALGMSKLEALQAAQSFGVYGKAAGLSGKENAKFSTGLAALGTDLASFYNSSPEEAIAAIGSGLRGEAEPLRKFGILLDDATLRQEALKMGLIKTTKEALTPANKVLAARSAIMKQSKVAQGDFAKTSGGLANQQRILAAQWTDAKGKIGGFLLPAVLGAVKGLNGLFDVLGSVKEGLSGVFSILAKGDFKGAASTFGLMEDSTAVDVLFRIRDGLVMAGDAVRLFFGAFTGKGADVEMGALGNTIIDLASTARAAFDTIVPTVQRLASTFVTSLLPAVMRLGQVFITTVVPTVLRLAAAFVANLLPSLLRLGQIFVGTVIPAVVAVVGYFVSNLLPIILRLWTIVATNVIPIIGSLARWFTGSLLPAVISIVRSVASSLKPVLDQLFATISGKVIPIVAQIIARFREWQPTIQKVISVLVTIIGWVLKLAAAILGKVLPPVIRFAGFLLGTVVGAVLAVIGVIIKVIGKVVEFGGVVVRAVSKVGEFTSGIKRKFGEAIDFVKGIPGKVKGALGNVGDLLKSAGGDIINGFIRGISDGFRRVKDKLGELTSLLPDWKGPKALDKVILRDNGRLVINGFVDGMKDRESSVRAYLGGLTTDLSAAASAGASGPSSAVPAGAAPLVGSLTLESRGNAREDLEEALFQLRRLQRGG